MQSRKASSLEAFANTCVGWAINFTANLVILPYFGFTSITSAKAFGIGVVFTVISLARSYFLRRVFNRIAWGNQS